MGKSEKTAGERNEKKRKEEGRIRGEGKKERCMAENKGDLRMQIEDEKASKTRRKKS